MLTRTGMVKQLQGLGDHRVMSCLGRGTIEPLEDPWGTAGGPPGDVWGAGRSNHWRTTGLEEHWSYSPRSERNTFFNRYQIQSFVRSQERPRQRRYTVTL